MILLKQAEIWKLVFWRVPLRGKMSESTTPCVGRQKPWGKTELGNLTLAFVSIPPDYPGKSLSKAKTEIIIQKQENKTCHVLQKFQS